jgi:hypothetical protein
MLPTTRPTRPTRPSAHGMRLLMRGLRAGDGWLSTRAKCMKTAALGALGGLGGLFGEVAGSDALPDSVGGRPILSAVPIVE